MHRVTTHQRVTTQLPLQLVDDLRVTATRLSCSRAEIMRRALEHYLEALEELEDIELATQRLDDPDDEILDWDQVRHKHLAPD